MFAKVICYAVLWGYDKLDKHIYELYYQHFYDCSSSSGTNWNEKYRVKKKLNYSPCGFVCVWVKIIFQCDIMLKW